MTSLHTIVGLLDTTLNVSEIKDAPMAMNGLQVENDGCVSKVALAVDGSQKTIEAAIAEGADLLILHHGIYWCGLVPMTGWFRKKISACLDHRLAVYSAHLPLDIHPELGNNACISKALGLTGIHPEINIHGAMVGMAGEFPGTVGELQTAYAAITGADITGYITDPEAQAGKIAVCSGAAGDQIYQLHAKGYRTYLTGEENHWVRNAAEDLGMNLLFAGHYATETFGVRALGDFLHARFGLPTVFIDHPTGM